ncbi:SLAM family member 9-like [Polypterus senegalus]|uniref:SLAM family member 9-like n=1 Tax=Polypterus senegalus TaxID=55291 RepID=UPI001964DA21|nr:SLAM family member 9-like [Polypterus senegalus]
MADLVHEQDWNWENCGRGLCLAEICEVYRPTGKVIEMQPMLTEEQKLSLKEFKWCFGEYCKIRIVKYQGDNIVLAPNFKFKAEYRKSDFVLILKNLTTEDTGIYTASVLNNESESTELISYKLFLQDPVRQLSNKEFQILNSDGSCNITLNCSVGAGTEVTLKWKQIGANESLITSHKASHLEYSAHYRAGSHASFTCFAENKVSNLSLTTRKLCEPDMPKGISLLLLIISIVSPIIILFAVILVIFCYRKTHRKNFDKDESDANTVYAGIAEVNEQVHLFFFNIFESYALKLFNNCWHYRCDNPR